MDSHQAISEEIKSQPEIYTGSFQGIKCDVTREEEVIEVFSQIKSKYGSISILINNAANMDTVTEEISSKTANSDIRLGFVIYLCFMFMY